jgi:hypothetical protein
LRGINGVRFLGRFVSAAGALRIGDMRHVAQKNYAYLFQLKEA